jgi:hypothetical protein
MYMTKSTVYLYKHASGTEAQHGTEFDPALEIHVSPNPARDRVAIRVSGSGQARACVYDLRGRQIDRVMPSGGGLSWNAAKFPAGIYIIKVETDGRAYSKRLLIQR